MSRRLARSLFGALALGLALSHAHPAAAAPDDDKAKARDLFTKGAQAVEEGRAAEGLPMLTEAERLFHAPTHLLYIARAQAATTKLLEARETYKKLIGEALPAKASKPFLDAQANGRKELAALEGRIPRVIVQVEPQPSDLNVTLDAASLPKALGESIEINPGAHTVVAKAAGYVDGSVTVMAPEGRTTEVRIKLALEKKGGPVTPVEPEPDSGGDWPPMRIASIPLMAVGGAGLVAGGAMGIVSLLKTSDADDQFEACGAPCRDEITSLDEEAATLGTASIIGMAAGAAVLTTGIILFVVGGDGEPAPAQSGSARMLAGPGFIGVEGAF
ncbi:MAG: hypothetical protein HOV80_33970 [Polyangiaceae bacterium]|nr:hypothetical protein [Polyangiaceae bacterium]